MTYLRVFICVLGFSSCLGDNDDIRYGNRRDYENEERLKAYAIVGSDYRKEKEDIWRPCSLDDYECMGRFLSSSSQCIPVHGYMPDPIHLPFEKFYFPVATMTISHRDARVRGFKKANVTEFYVNKGTGNVVIGVTIPTYNFTSNAHFTYQRSEKEPIALNDYNTFENDKVILTAAIPKFHDLRLDMADIHANIPNVEPRYYIGPKAYTSNDPEVISGFTKFKANTVQIVREVFVLHSYYLMTVFIQKELCDFGIDSYQTFNGYLAFHRGYSKNAY